MDLSTPVDVYVLRVLSDGDICNPVRAHWLITEQYSEELETNWGKEPWTRPYISLVMTKLLDRELLDRVPPESSGLYQINEFGYVAITEYAETGRTQFSYRDLVAAVEDLPSESERPGIPSDVEFRPPDA